MFVVIDKIASEKTKVKDRFDAEIIFERKLLTYKTNGYKVTNKQLYIEEIE